MKLKPLKRKNSSVEKYETLIKDEDNNGKFTTDKNSVQTNLINEPITRKRKKKSKDDISPVLNFDEPEKSVHKSKNKKVTFESVGNVQESMVSSEGDEDRPTQDNTPQSLKKKKKIKKKKKKELVINKLPTKVLLEYLIKWKNERKSWKFEKVKQIRLVANMFNKEILPDDHFPTFLEYMEGSSKSMKDLLLKLANEVISEMEKWENLSDVEKETSEKVDEDKYERARSVLQMLL